MKMDPLIRLMALCLVLSGTSLTTTPLYAAPKIPAKVVIIGLDGVSLNLLEPYVKQGVTPNLGALMQQGARGELASIWPLRTPQVWTSVATGKLPGQHGIWDHLSNTYFNPPEFRTKAKSAVTTENLRSKPLWRLLGDAGIATLNVGWMAAWPAQEVPHGVVVAPIELMKDARQTTIKGSFYRGAKKMTAPQRLDAKVQKLIVDPNDIGEADVADFAKLPSKDSPIRRLPYMERYIYALRWSLARARSVEAITLGLLDDANPAVVLSYFQCTDSLLHRFWIFQEGADNIRQRFSTHGIDATHAEELHQRFGKVVEACYRDVDARVGRILAATQGPQTLVLVVSDHGFGPAPVPHRLKGEPYSGDHLESGIILAQGPGIKPGSRLEGASVLDVTPTVLHSLGQAVAADMRGRVLLPVTQGLNPGQVKTIATYEDKPQLEVPYAEGWPKRSP
ncbi:MAG: alkaline phosphatase family protein [Myxococcota bacterium]